MNNILPFKTRRQSDDFNLDSKVRALLVHLKRLARCGETLQQATGFGLADQVLTHAMVTAAVPFEILLTGEALRPQRRSISAITRDRYDLDVSADHGSDPDTLILEAEDLLRTWDETALVQYVLDHDVPVDLSDMPGKIHSARLAG